MAVLRVLPWCLGLTAAATWAAFCLHRDWSGRAYMSWLRRHALYHFGLVVVAFSYAWSIGAFLGSFLYSMSLWHDALGRLWGWSPYAYAVAALYYGVLDSFTGYDYPRYRHVQENRTRTRTGRK